MIIKALLKEDSNNSHKIILYDSTISMDLTILDKNMNINVDIPNFVDNDLFDLQYNLYQKFGKSSKQMQSFMNERRHINDITSSKIAKLEKNISAALNGILSEYLKDLSDLIKKYK